MKYCLCLILFLFTSCNQKDYEDIKLWKYIDGSSEFGDILYLDKIKNDTIYHKQKPIGTILKIEERWLSNDILLEIKSIKSENISTFVSK